MQVKLVRSPNAGQKDMVVHLSRGTKEVALGQSIEVPDADVEYLQKRFPGCFEAVKETPKPAVEAKAKASAASESKMVKSYENKSASEWKE